MKVIKAGRPKTKIWAIGSENSLKFNCIKIDVSKLNIIKTIGKKEKLINKNLCACFEIDTSE